ncbi:MAG: AAA family ATPase [Desulfobacterales bacterium]|nr:AAA family ATPase [Desulfobacterales bacterium]
MKIANIHLENFKRFKSLDIEVRNGLTGDIADQFLILGDNGAGKTTVLQAVALCLSIACGRTRSVEDLNWLGWVPGRYEQWGEPGIELEVHFSDDEIQATREAADRWARGAKNGRMSDDFARPGGEKIVRLSLRGSQCAASTPEEFSQFRGRWFATRLLKTDPKARDLFEHLPGVFWFDQFRNLATPPARMDWMDREPEEPTGRISFDVGVTRLREHLNRWQLNRLTGASESRDFLTELENGYRLVFPDRSFHGPEPMYKGGAPTPEDYYFLLSDGNRTYDIEEMSAGEQAVFPMLYEFIRQQVRNSVVLVDEIDLNLHPPLAQSLLAALPAIGPGCQFLLTTHAEAISNLVSPEQIHRLKGGCL